MIPEDKVREVADRVSIVEVVSEYVQLRRSGSNFLGLCPFHGEKTPSFNVNPAREIFHCFGCGAGGSAFAFIMKIEGISFPEAVKFLARKSGVEIEERQLTTAEKKTQDERQQFQKINELTAQFYRNVLQQTPEGAGARDYLDRRGANGEIAESYRLGFAPDRSDGLVQHLKTHSVNLENALKLGVVRKSDRGWYDQFRNRLMFPIRDSKGNVIAFAGRVLDNSLPKYINSPESPLYHKSSILFGLDLALPTIRTERAVIFVEGYFDHLALYRAGVRNVVATCGTALTAAHAGLLKRHLDRVYMLFDSDSAGRKATVRSMELFLEQKMSAYVIALPAGEDPDSFMAGNPVETFVELQKKSRPAFDFFVRSVLTLLPPDSVDNKLRAIDLIVPRFRKIADPIERDLYEKEVCRLMGITVHAFRKRMGGITLSAQDTGTDLKQTSAHSDNSQESLLAVLVNYPDARAEAARIGVENMFQGIYIELAEAIINALADSDDPKALSEIENNIQTADLKMLWSKILVSEGQMANVEWRDVFRHCLKNREKRELSSIKEIASKLAVLNPESEEYTQLLKQADSLRNRKSRL